MNKYLLAGYIVVVIVLLMCTTREPFVEVFGFAGYTKPTSVSYDETNIPIQDSDFTPQDNSEITPDIVNSVVQLIQKYIKLKKEHQIIFLRLGG